MTKKRVVFATISLHKMAGGLERNIIRISNYLASRGHEVSLLSFDLPEAEAFYPIDPKVTWQKVGRTAPHQSIGFFDRLKLLGRIRDVVSGDGHATVIVFHHGLLARLMLATLGLKTKIICSERSALTIYDHILASKWNLNFLLMFFVSKILVQFESYRQDYPFLMRSKIQAIPNVVEPSTVRAQSEIPNAEGRFTILAVGRLCDQKNYKVLIDAFAKISSKFPEWDLLILGDGGLRQKLQQQIDDAGLASRMMLQGASQNVAQQYAQGHIYAMPSKWEGFPNALAEALAAGLPSIGYKDCAGVRDLIRHGRNGLLAEGNGNVTSLAEQLSSLMSDPALRASMSSDAVQSVASYTADQIYPQWENLL